VRASRPHPPGGPPGGLSIIAGTTPALSWWRITVSSIAGALPPAIAYAVAGHFATEKVGVIWVFAALMLLSAVMWWFDRRDAA
jgi:uncharacterized membrane protein YdjX (TVP38/TMEM64 family)